MSQLVSAACPLSLLMKEFAKYFVGSVSRVSAWPWQADIFATRRGLVSIQATSYLIITQVGEQKT